MSSSAHHAGQDGNHANSWPETRCCRRSGYRLPSFATFWRKPLVRLSPARRLFLPTYSKPAALHRESGGVAGAGHRSRLDLRTGGRQRVGLHRAHPKAENDEAYYQRLAAFKSMHLTPATVAQRERLVVVKELAGNLATAGLMAGGLLLARLYSLRLARITGLVLVVLVVISLIWLHRESRTRQKQYEEAAITRGST